MREGWLDFLTAPALELNEQRVHMDEPEAGVTLARAVFNFGQHYVGDQNDIVLVCIGTDRSTGDALGPLVGSQLADMRIPGCTVLGTLDNPVHATNLAETLERVQTEFADPFVLAVDASLGRTESVGFLTVGRGSLKPGAAVNKTLPAVGQVYVTGVVNVGGFMEYLVLQNTRLSLVYRMARVTAEGLMHGVRALLERRAVACSSAHQ